MAAHELIFENLKCLRYFFHDFQPIDSLIGQLILECEICVVFFAKPNNRLKFDLLLPKINASVASTTSKLIVYFNVFFDIILAAILGEARD